MTLAEEITVQKNVSAEMRDGTTLVADVYRPAENGEYPVLLTRLPYGKDQSINPEYMNPIKAAQHGYIVILQDVRGRFDSEGEWYPFVNEFEDGYDAVEWAAGLPGSNGKVGMYGASYPGMTQWQAAVMRPPALKAMAPGLTWGNHLNSAMYRGGVRELGLWFYWSEGVLAPNTLFRRYHDDPAKLGEELPALVDVIDHIHEEYGILPLKELPNQGGVVPYMFDGLEHGITSDMWKNLNIDDRYAYVEASTFHIGGWYDVFLGETFRQYEAMKKVAAERGATPPRLLLGPWSHGTDFPSTVGDLDFGFVSSGVFLNCKGNVTDYHLWWFDATLKGDEAALAGQPPVQVFVMGENRWRGFEEWPVPGSREERWHLQAGSVLSREEPADTPPMSMTTTPKILSRTSVGRSLCRHFTRPGRRISAQTRSDRTCSCTRARFLRRTTWSSGRCMRRSMQHPRRRIRTSWRGSWMFTLMGVRSWLRTGSSGRALGRAILLRVLSSPSNRR